MALHPYAGKTRLRACGLLVESERLLIVRQHLPTRPSPVWMPPGGGVETGESLEQALLRELKEETGLSVTMGELLYIHEFIEPPWHAVEFYFRCSRAGGELNVGRDPEFGEEEQILRELRFAGLETLRDLDLYPEHIRLHFQEEFQRPPEIRHIRTVSGGR